MLRMFAVLFIALLASCTFAPPKRAQTPSGSPATMRPYVVFDKKYQPQEKPQGHVFRGTASWYGDQFHGRKTANGERYNMHDLTAAHTTLPMNTQVRVQNLNNNKHVVVRINDRGPFAKNRVIDLSRRAAEVLGMIGSGTAPVEVTVLNGKKTPLHPAASPAQNQNSATDDMDVWLSNSAFFDDNTSLYADDKISQNPVWAVQIGAFSQIDSAEQWRQQYHGYQGFPAAIRTEEQNGQQWYKVYLHGFANESAARFFVEQSPFHGAFIRPF